jgi:hypothetical protein
LSELLVRVVPAKPSQRKVTRPTDARVVESVELLVREQFELLARRGVVAADAECEALLAATNARWPSLPNEAAAAAAVAAVACRAHPTTQ